jgi:hypothetical protein
VVIKRPVRFAVLSLVFSLATLVIAAGIVYLIILIEAAPLLDS